MTDRQPYIDALAAALPGGQWVACGLSPNRIRSEAFEDMDILFAHDRPPTLTIMRRPYILPVDPQRCAARVAGSVCSAGFELCRAGSLLQTIYLEGRC
jgi:hypothetical protein